MKEALHKLSQAEVEVCAEISVPAKTRQVRCLRYKFYFLAKALLKQRFYKKSDIYEQD